MVVILFTIFKRVCLIGTLSNEFLKQPFPLEREEKIKEYHILKLQLKFSIKHPDDVMRGKSQ